MNSGKIYTEKRLNEQWLIMQVNIRKPNEAEKKIKFQTTKEAHNCRARLLIQQPFIGILAMRMDLISVIDSRLPTASTNCKAIFINADFFLSLKNKQRIYLLAHEIWHCVLMHFLRKGNREHKRFNYASDLEVDFLLSSQGFEPFEILPHEPDWIGKSAEGIYELLDNNESRTKESDVHVYPEDKADELPVSLKYGKNKPIVLDDDYNPGYERNTERTWREWVITATQQIERTKGDLPAYLKKIIKDQYTPELDWCQILQQFVTYCFGGKRRWLPPSRRYIYRDLYLPSRKNDFLSVVVAVDTSGSTSSDLPNFLSELKGIVSSFGRYNVILIECDAEIQRVRQYNEFEPFEYTDFEITGGGGTDFIPVFDYVNENSFDTRLLIFLTDGYGDGPEKPPDYPVLWVLTKNGKPPVSWGWKTYLNR